MSSITPRRAMVLAWCGVAACAVGLWVTSCTQPAAGVCIYPPGTSLDAQTLDRIAKTLPLLPADPWPCIVEIHVDEACTGTHGCYWPDEYRILTTQAALAHELGHAAGECAGDYDPQHRAAWWREVDR